MRDKPTMSNEPVVSVIMAVHNGAPYLRKSMDGILSQTFRNFELVVTDDASTDETPEILKQYERKDSRVRVITSRKNLQAAGARNLCLRSALGRYIAVNDADDVSLPGRLQTQFFFMESHPEYFLTAGKVIRIDEAGRETTFLDIPTDEGFLPRSLPSQNWITHSTVMFRNDGRHFYREKFITGGEDYDFFLRLLTECKRMLVLPEVLILYRVLASPCVSRKRAQYKLLGAKAQEFYRQRLKNGKDEYDAFDPEPILNIDFEQTTEPLVLNDFICNAFSRFELKTVRQLIRRYWRTHGFSKHYCGKYIGSFLGKDILGGIRNTKWLLTKQRVVMDIAKARKPHVALLLNLGYGLNTFVEIGSLAREMALYKRLAGNGYDVSFFTFDRSRRLTQLDFSANIIPQWPWIRPRHIIYLYFWLLPFLRYRSGRKVSVLVTNQGFNTWIAIVAGWLWRAKVIARCGYVCGEEAETLGFSGRRLRRKIRFEKWTFTHADRCFIPTRKLADWVVKNYGIDRGKIDIVPNFVDTDRFLPEDRNEREIDVLCVGRLADVKRHHLILEALKGFKAKVTFIGSGPLESQLQEMAAANGVDLTIIKRVPTEELPCNFNNARIYIIASEREGHSKSLIEAMACGCACVGTRSPGIENQIHDEETGLLADPTPESISECVNLLLEDETLRKTLGANARQYALDHFSLDKVFYHYKKTIASLAGVSSFHAGSPSETARD